MRALRALALAAVAAYAAHSLLGVGTGSLNGLFENWIYNAAIVAGAALATIRAITVTNQRAAWTALAAGLVCWTAGEIVYTLDPGVKGSTFPSTADLLWLVYYPASFITLVLLVRARVRVFYSSLWLDGIVGALALAAVATQFVFPPIVAATGERGSSVVADLIYPVGDLLLMVFVVAVLALTGWRPGRTLKLVAAGLALGAAADSWSLYWSATGHDGSSMLDFLWPASAVLLGCAAWARGETPTGVDLAGRRLLVFPLAFATTALALLAANAVSPLHEVAYVLAVVTLAGAVARMAATFVENVRLAERSRNEALTDALTGLANRRCLMLDLEAAASSGRRHTLAIFDLNGFKRYNDTYGHPSGDELLVTLGGRLEAAAEGLGIAYRLGGDEFCVLYDASQPVGDVALAAARAALSDRGRGILVTTSYGVVELPREAADVAAALQRADERLYANKRSSRSAPVELADIPLTPPTGGEVVSR